MNILNKLILTFFFVGYIKYAPGTIASFLLLLIWYFIPNILLLQASILFLILLILFSSLYVCNYFSIVSEEKDPGYIVIDEILGMSISLFMIPKNIALYFLAFIIFRFFDILKPSIIYNVQDFEKGLDILADDFFAGIFTLIILFMVI